MRLLAVFLFFLCAPSWAGQWVSIEADHANLLYSEGETAFFTFRKMIRPVSPDYAIETKISVNNGAEEKIGYHEGSGTFAIEDLEAGITSIVISTKILGPSGFEKSVQFDSTQLTVNAGGNSR